jgi:polysaccharide biosynthesis protein PslG
MDPSLPDGDPAALDAQMALMASSGVQSVRTNLNWDALEPGRGQYDWSSADRIVRAAASHGLQLLPIIEFTPLWASSHPSGPFNFSEYPPAHNSDYGAFMTTIVDRYGPNGSFWRDNPSLRKVPIKDWQIWNEPAGTNYDWRSSNWSASYTALLKAAYKAVHLADRTAVVVTGAMVGLNTTTKTPWAETRDLYRHGAKRYFDALAVNAFTGGVTATAAVDRSLEIVKLARQVMLNNHDAGTPIWVTEVTWPASAGRIPRSVQIGIETTPKGQAQRLSAYYTRIASSHAARIQRAYWYTWFSPYSPIPMAGNPATFQYTGLVQWDLQAGHPFVPLPILSTYAKVAAKFEGCRHNTQARCA